MEQPATTHRTAWLLFAVSIIGMLIFAVLYSSSRKQSSTDKDFKPDAIIPEQYNAAFNAISNYNNATWVKQDHVLFGMRDF